MKYDKEHIEIIVKALSEKKGRVTACKLAGITFETFSDWMENKPEFSELVKNAELRGNEFGEEYAIMSIFRAMEKNWQAGAWWLERNFPEKYKDRKEFNHSGKIQIDSTDEKL